MITDMGFILPEEDDFYNIQDFNNNFKLAEETLGRLDGNLNDTVKRVDGISRSVDGNHSELNDLIGMLGEKNDSVEDGLESVIKRFNFAADFLLSRFSIADTGLCKGVCNTSGDALIKYSVLLPFGWALTDGATFGIKFTVPNTHTAPKLEVQDGSKWLGSKEMRNEKGRICYPHNNVIADYPGKYQIFRYDAGLSAFIWLMAISE